MTIMNTMVRVLLSSFTATVCIGLVTADPTANVVFKKVDIQVFDNPYFGDWQGAVDASGESITNKIPMKKDIPATMMMRATTYFAGSELGGIDMPLCEALGDQTIGKSMFEAIIPKGKFPKSCPIPANEDYVLSKYMVAPDMIPAGIPDGLASADIEFYEPGKDPYVKMQVEGVLSHKIPGLGR